MNPPIEGSAIEEYFVWENDSEVQVIVNLDTNERAHFIPLADIKTYFGANDAGNLTRILQEIFRTQDLPIEPDLILQDHTAVLCILLRVGQGWLIEEFAYYEELSDRRLPFDSTRPQQEFPMIEEDSSFLERFCDNQWRYCVPTFESHMLHKRFGQQRLLPIIEQELPEVEGLAVNRVVKIYGPYNKLSDVTGKTAVLIGFEDTPDSNKFVLRTYFRTSGDNLYKQELNVFRSFKNADGIIRFYGSYIQGDSMNIILEYADRGSLEDYLRAETPPSRGMDIIRFWDSMFQLIEALKTVHSFRRLVISHPLIIKFARLVADLLSGHGKITPDTVVVVSNGSANPSDWQFKLAGFGVGTKNDFERGEPNSNTTKRVREYGSPESCLPNDYDEPREADTWEDDIWSLGCIYSEAAIWISDGYRGLEEYRKGRTSSAGNVSFHDGERVLQKVLDTHRDIEDRLRRSDYITKDVLDSMVDEMLWEEDRPNSKALSRKADVIISRSRKKVSPSSSRKNSNSSRALPPPRLPPSQPLPSVPPKPSLSSISERQVAVADVDNWRSQVTLPQSTSPSVNGVDQSPVIPSRQMSFTVSESDLDRENCGSLTSWKHGDDASAASTISSFPSPRPSIRYDHHKHSPNEGMHRTYLSPYSHDERRGLMASSPPQAIVHELPADEANIPYPLIPQQVPPTVPPLPQQIPPLPPSPPQAPPQVVRQEHNRGQSEGNSQKQPDDDSSRPGHSISRASSRNSSSIYSMPTSRSTYSTETKLPIISKSQKRFGIFSSRSVSAPVLIGGPVANSPQDFLSVDTCLQWKKAYKKTKKSSKVPPLPGANIIETMRGRDHIFIVDDSASMANVWPEVKRVFEALTYVVKGMSSNGTELFFTIAYDTYLRKDTSELCTLLESKELAGKTNISYRLNLQLQSYEMKLLNASRAKGKKSLIRPMSFYILSDGQWGEGIDPMIPIHRTASFLKEQNVEVGQVTIQFITFAESTRAMQRFSGLSKEDFGL
ncbi:hypothetical protein HYFRA_00004061 [Hymenoscyphus fraxineus]|uniref:Protein kinase domain-containing protein n=1 Tax=Hymenoscyphus fraxineus TaxID=746836 RepID=A0A9N9KMK9_9HELO|nr:hypothetical protein HYFRA_00004061 [Hymenoscyphus fraxineus]